jgi:SAM-dependent methyltransferase
VKLAERLLLSLSHEPTEAARNEGSLETALSLLTSAFPGFERDIVGKDILDFGCGAGLQSAAMALGGANHVLGLDTNPRTLDQARELADKLSIQSRIEFAERLDARHRGAFDIVISQNSMEHFPDPAAVLEEMRSALKPGGKILVTFGPPWFSPYGSHMSFFTPVPWVSLLFPESAVMCVRSRFISDGAMRYEDVEGGLNRMTVRGFERLVEQCGLDAVHRRYQCIKRLDCLSKLPLARELFVNHVSCVLTLSSSR